jgi:hypothetical protein
VIICHRESLDTLGEALINICFPSAVGAAGADNEAGFAYLIIARRQFELCRTPLNSFAQEVECYPLLRSLLENK